MTITDYTYDGITLLALSATQGTAAWTVTYLYDEDGRPYAGVYTSGTAPVSFLIATNDRGDVVGLTNTAGTWFARYTYDPYGRVLSQTTQAAGAITSTLASQIATRQVLRYASYAYDAHSATYYLSARHYDPATMRFLTKDPARDDGEESGYQYCGGDPVGKVDPSGEFAVAAAGALVVFNVVPVVVGAAVVVGVGLQVWLAYAGWRNFVAGASSARAGWTAAKNWWNGRIKFKCKIVKDPPDYEPGSTSYNSKRDKLLRQGGDRAWHAFLKSRAGAHWRPHFHLHAYLYVNNVKIFAVRPLLW